MKINPTFKQQVSKSFIDLSLFLVLLLFSTTLIAQAPSSILPDIVNFKINYPLDENGNDYTGVAYEDRDNPPIISEVETNLSGYTAPSPYLDYFQVSGNEVVFKAHCAGALTSINAYPRCELRERPGGTDSFWNFSDEQELNATFRVTHLPDIKKEVCMLQIKGNNTNSTSNTSEVLRLEYREGSQGLHLVKNESTTLNYIMNYSLGETIEARLYVNNDDVTVTLTNISTGDTYSHQYTSDYSLGYFKAGCYTQSSIWAEKNGIADELPTAYGEVRFSSLTLGATCVPTPLSNLQATNIGETTATLNWDYDPNMDHYNARYRPNGSSVWEYKYSLHAGTVDLLGLSDDTEYEWQVRAKCPDGSATNYVDGPGPNFTTLVVGGLPVELINFKGNFEDRNKQIALVWQTASETNNQGFYIERALHPSDGFESIGWIAGKGHSTALTTYHFNDQEIKRGQNYYYRLQQLDFDEGTSFSKTIALQTGRSEEAWSVFPNPMLDNITVHPKELSQAKAGLLRLIDVNGNVVFSERHLLQKGEAIALSIGHLPPGIYVLIIATVEGEVLVTKRMIRK